MSFSAAGPSVSVIGNWVDINSPGMYTVSASGPSCTSVSQTVSILQNTVAPTSSVSPSTQSISCFSSPPVSFTGTATGPTTNIVHKWFGPLSPLPNGGPLKIDNTLNSVLTGTFSPGTYTLQTIDQSNGCSTTKTVSITSADAFPVFTASSSTSFSMGCFPLDQTTLSIINAQSTQTPATPLSYTFLPPGFSGTLAAPPYNLNSVQITSLSGTWTLIVNDNGNNCKTMLPVAVISDTQPPHPMAVLLTRTLTCNTPTIQAICSSSTQNASFEWLWPGMMIFPGMKVIQIGDPQYGPLTSTTSLFYANYTVIATNSVNACQTQSIIPIYQNFQPPLFIPKILPNPTVICGNNPVVASYDYTCNGCPLPFLPNP